MSLYSLICATVLIHTFTITQATGVVFKGLMRGILKSRVGWLVGGAAAQHWAATGKDMIAGKRK